MNPPDQPSPDRPFLLIDSAPRDGRWLECELASKMYPIMTLRYIDGWRDNHMRRYPDPLHWREILPVAECEVSAAVPSPGGSGTARTDALKAQIGYTSHWTEHAAALETELSAALARAERAERDLATHVSIQELLGEEFEGLDDATQCVTALRAQRDEALARAEQAEAERDDYERVFSKTGLENLELVTERDDLTRQLAEAKATILAVQQTSAAISQSGNDDYGRLMLELAEAKARVENPQPGYGDLWEAFVAGAKEARLNPTAQDRDFNRAADAYCKLIHAQLAPEYCALIEGKKPTILETVLESHKQKPLPENWPIIAEYWKKQTDDLRAALASAEAERDKWKEDSERQMKTIKRLSDAAEDQNAFDANKARMVEMDFNQLRATVATLTAERDEAQKENAGFYAKLEQLAKNAASMGLANETLTAENASLNADIDRILSDPTYEGGVQWWIAKHAEVEQAGAQLAAALHGRAEPTPALAVWAESTKASR